jgi:hypothetical protein
MRRESGRIAVVRSLRALARQELHWDNVQESFKSSAYGAGIIAVAIFESVLSSPLEFTAVTW